MKSVIKLHEDKVAPNSAVVIPKIKLCGNAAFQELTMLNELPIAFLKL